MLNKNHLVKVKGSYVVLIKWLIILTAILYTCLSLAAPKHKLNRLAGSINKADRIIITADSAMSRLVREKIFLESRIEMAMQDSIGMVIEIPDSTIGLEIKGVRLHTADINRAKYGNFFLSLDDLEYDLLMGSPLRVVKHRANFEKEPVKVVDAPEDSLLSNPDLNIADTSSSVSARVKLQLDNGIKIILIDSRASFIKRSLWDVADRFTEFGSGLKDVIRLRVPDYHPVLKIYLPGKEIRTLYRAIPANGRIALKV